MIQHYLTTLATQLIAQKLSQKHDLQKMAQSTKRAMLLSVFSGFCVCVAVLSASFAFYLTLLENNFSPVETMLIITALFSVIACIIKIFAKRNSEKAKKHITPDSARQEDVIDLAFDAFEAFLSGYNAPAQQEHVDDEERVVNIHDDLDKSSVAPISTHIK